VHNSKSTSANESADDATARIETGQTANSVMTTDDDIRKELGEFERTSIHIQRRMLLVTAAVAAVTALYVIVTFLQYLAMRDQIADARRASAKASAVTERQLRVAESQAVSLKLLADAAKTSAEIAKTSAAANLKFQSSLNRTALTAGVICEPTISTAETPPLGQTWRVTIEVFNQYDRPASSVHVKAAALATRPTLAMPLNRFEEVILMHGSIPRSNGLRPPKQLSFVDARTGHPLGPITKDMFDAIKSKRIQLVVFGEMSYNDTAGCHRQQFCELFDPNIKTGGPTSVPTGAWTTCAIHNEETECTENR